MYEQMVTENIPATTLKWNEGFNKAFLLKGHFLHTYEPDITCVKGTYWTPTWASTSSHLRSLGDELYSLRQQGAPKTINFFFFLLAKAFVFLLGSQLWLQITIPEEIGLGCSPDQLNQNFCRWRPSIDDFFSSSQEISMCGKWRF